jgi:transposase
MPKHPNPRDDAKAEALRRQGELHSHPENVQDELFHTNEFFDARDLVQVKYEMLRRAQVDGMSIAQAAASFGFSRPLFYHAQEAFQDAGLPGLIRKRPGPRHAHKLTDEVIAFIERLRADDETADSAAIAEELRQKFQLTVHPRTIERALNRKRKKGRQR